MKRLPVVSHTPSRRAPTSLATSMTDMLLRRSTTAAAGVGGVSGLLHTRNQRRTYVNCIRRGMHDSLFPSHGLDGEPIDVDLARHQINNLFIALGTTTLVDKQMEMPPMPYIDSIFPSDLLISYQDMLMPMPKYGIEHRASEISDILRFIKGMGSPGDIAHVLQDSPGARANGGDFVNIPEGLLMAFGKNRSTNTIAYDTLIGSTVRVNDVMQKQAFPIFGIPVEDDTPLLGDFCFFSGKRTLFIHDNKHGEKVSNHISKLQNRVPWQIVKIEDGCNMLTFHGGLSSTDVIVEDSFEDSIDRISAVGMTAFPIEWSEMRKLGISMRRLCLIARFAMGSYSGGIKGHQSKTSSRALHNNKNFSKTYHGGAHVKGDMAAPLEAQIRSKEIPDMIYQPPPRYVPPMHGRGSVAAYDNDFANSQAGDEDAVMGRMFGKAWREAGQARPKNTGSSTHHRMDPGKSGTQAPDPYLNRRF